MSNAYVITSKLIRKFWKRKAENDMMTEEQAKALLLKQESVYTRAPELREAAFAYCEGYKTFLNASKTEREAVVWAVRQAEENGFVPYDPAESYRPGDRVYQINRGKSVTLASSVPTRPRPVFRSLFRILIRRGWTLSSVRCMSRPVFPISKHITTAVSRNISGRRCRWPSTVRF